MPDCAFCDRVSFETQIVKETDNFFVIHSRRPLSRAHCILIPKKHLSEDIAAISEFGEEFIILTNSTMQALKMAFGSVGVNFFANFGKVAGQEIPHVHFHIIPRYTDETISPFQILNKPELYASVKTISPEVLKQEIDVIRTNYQI